MQRREAKPVWSGVDLFNGLGDFGADSIAGKESSSDRSSIGQEVFSQR